MRFRPCLALAGHTQFRAPRNKPNPILFDHSREIRQINDLAIAFDPVGFHAISEASACSGVKRCLSRPGARPPRYGVNPPSQTGDKASPYRDHPCSLCNPWLFTAAPFPFDSRADPARVSVVPLRYLTIDFNSFFASV